ncbi:MAG: C13 family peptidase [Gammaproteobacteria bacterium]
MPTYFADSLVGNFLAGLRLAAGRSVAPAEFRAAPQQLIFALAGYWVLLFLGGTLIGGPAAAFSVWGLVTAAGRFHLWLSLVVLFAWLTASPRAAALLVIALLYAGLPVTVVSASVAALGDLLVPQAEPRYERLRLLLTGAWAVLIFWRASGLVCGRAHRQRALGTGAYALALGALLVHLPSLPLFHPMRASAGGPQFDIEAIYYRQGGLLDAQLAALESADPAAVDLYFVAVAPYASEDVFMREVLAARDIVERRLGLDGRTLALVNNPATIDELPLANGPNLRHALRGLAAKIDRDDDIVFIYLTSHGDENASLTAEFPPLAPNDIHAHELRAALDEAGILWRVIVVSACFSGSFIEQLQSPTTLVITAAAADRASFGCSHENHWTYFGEAFFATALARHDDLVAAAYEAQALIDAREKQEGRVPSQPQVVAGRHIEGQLARWQAQRKRSHSSESM